MKKIIAQAAVVALLMLAVSHVVAFELIPSQTNGVYELAIPERSPAGQTQKLDLEVGEVNGKKMLATRACSRCPAAAYSYLATESAELGRPVYFNSMGIYVMAYDNNTFVSVMAGGQLGKKPWAKIAYANVYSKKGSPSISLEAGKQFVLAESQRLMTGEGVAEFKVAGGDGIYYTAARQTVGSKQYDQINVSIVPKKKIHLEGMNCRSCTSDTYLFTAELSAAIGKNVYEKGNMGRFLIEQEKGVLWWTTTKLGKEESKDHSQFNVISQDKTAMRQLTQSKAAQDKIDSTIATYARQAKAVVAARYAKEELQRTANNQLPEKGKQDAGLESSALAAAQAWAKSYAWKETLKYVYLTSPDWTILRHKLTGIQTGRRIAGTIVMQRPDGLCSYQGAVFEQAYNGSDYQKTVMSGVVPGQNKLDCSKI